MSHASQMVIEKKNVSVKDKSLHHMINRRHKDNYTVSVIIPTIKRSTLLLSTKGLETQTRKPDELIIIEDLKRQGPSWSRNRGIEKAKGDLIAFLDDDCVPPSHWLESLISALDRHRADGVGGFIQETDPLFNDIRKRRGYPKNEVYDAGQWVGAGGNVIYAKHILDKLYQQQGYYFNETTLMVEDFELALKLLIIGAKFVYVPIEVVHLRKFTPLEFLKLQFGRGIGIANLYQIKKIQDNPSVKFQRSMLWAEAEKSSRPKWIKIFFYKIIGPFDVKSFRSIRNFLLFWLGEKIQSLGFASARFYNSR